MDLGTLLLRGVSGCPAPARERSGDVGTGAVQVGSAAQQAPASPKTVAVRVPASQFNHFDVVEDSFGQVTPLRHGRLQETGVTLQIRGQRFLLPSRRLSRWQTVGRVEGCMAPNENYCGIGSC